MAYGKSGTGANGAMDISLVVSQMFPGSDRLSPNTNICVGGSGPASTGPVIANSATRASSAMRLLLFK